MLTTLKAMVWENFYRRMAALAAVDCGVVVVVGCDAVVVVVVEVEVNSGKSLKMN